MASFKVTGGRRLKGEITPQGAKNEALQIISAVLLTDQVVRISNIPDIVDVNKLIDLLKERSLRNLFTNNNFKKVVLVQVFSGQLPKGKRINILYL